jgi:hypothetical protein
MNEAILAQPGATVKKLSNWIKHKVLKRHRRHLRLVTQEKKLDRKKRPTPKREASWICTIQELDRYRRRVGQPRVRCSLALRRRVYEQRPRTKAELRRIHPAPEWLKKA